MDRAASRTFARAVAQGVSEHIRDGQPDRAFAFCGGRSSRLAAFSSAAAGAGRTARPVFGRGAQRARLAGDPVESTSGENLLGAVRYAFLRERNRDAAGRERSAGISAS